MAGRDSVLDGVSKPLPEGTVVDLVHRHALARPDRVALRAAGEDRTFGDLWSRAASVATALMEHGVGPGDTVAVWAARTLDTIAAALAVMIAGAAYVPIEPTHPTGRAQAIIDAARPRLMLADGKAAITPPADLDVARLEIAAVPAKGRTTFAFPRAHDLAYVIFTSGSSGTPKGVLIEHRSLLNYASWCAATVGHAGSGTPLIGSMGFDLSITSLWPPLAMGRPVVICQGIWDGETIFGRPEPYAYVKVTPSMLRFFERTRSPRYDELTAVLVIGGELLETRLLREIADRLGGVRLMNHYGPTEATVGCCFHQFSTRDIPALPSVPIGRPVWNTRAYVVDRNLDPVPTGQHGELVIAGPGVARGYVQNDMNAPFVDESDVGGPAGRAYRTGDQVEVLPGGSLLYLGREDDQLKISGHRVEPGELRRVALQVPGVADVAFDFPADGAGRAFVVPDAGTAIGGLGALVRRRLAAMLPPAVVPARVHVVPEIVMNANGKCDVAATARRAAGDAQAPT